MNQEHDPPRGAGLDPADLDGFTIEQLSDYLDRGRSPSDPAIEQSPGCQLALDALERLRALGPALVLSDASAEPPPDEGWVQQVLAGITQDARAGRRVPISSTASGADLGITEGAIRGLVHAAEREVSGMLIGRCALLGEITEAGQPVTVRVEVSVPYGEPIPALVARLRSAIAGRLAVHTTMALAGIDIAVQDVRQLQQTHQEDQ